MILDKLKNLKTVKTIASTRKSSTKTYTNKNRKAPHTYLCEVLIYFNKYYVKYKNQTLPLNITEDNWVNAKYAYSTEENLNWHPNTLIEYKYDYFYANYLKKYWSLVKHGLKIRVYIENSIARLDINSLNEKHKKIVSKLNSKYYVINRRY